VRRGRDGRRGEGRDSEGREGREGRGGEGGEEYRHFLQYTLSTDERVSSTVCANIRILLVYTITFNGL